MIARLLFLSLITVCGSIHADLNRFSPESCEIRDNQIENHCLKSKAIEADKLLNQSYAELHKNIAERLIDNPVLISVLQEQIKKSQRAWIKLRDENCAIETFIFLPGEQIFNAVKNACLTRETIDRTLYLNNLSF